MRSPSLPATPSSEKPRTPIWISCWRISSATRPESSDGASTYYNVFLDYIIGGRFQTAGWHSFFYGHELERWTTIYDLLWDRDPDKTLTEIQAIYDYKIHDYDTFICNRHSDYYYGKCDDVLTFIKHTGLFTHAFAFAHSKTGDDKYIQWAKKMSGVFWSIRNPKTNLIRGCVQRQTDAWENSSTAGPGLLALFLMRGYQWSPEPELLEKSLAYLNGIYEYHRADDKGGFRASVACDGTDLKPGELEEYWEGPIRTAKAAALAYALTREPRMLELADSVVSNTTPEMEFPGSVVERCLISDAIEARSCILSTAIDLFELTADAEYLDRARALAEDAIARFLYRGLFASDMGFDLKRKPGPTVKIYDGRAGAGWLALNLIRLQQRVDEVDAGKFQKRDQLDRIYD